MDFLPDFLIRRLPIPFFIGFFKFSHISSKRFFLILSHLFPLRHALRALALRVTVQAAPCGGCDSEQRPGPGRRGGGGH